MVRRETVGGDISGRDFPARYAEPPPRGVGTGGPRTFRVVPGILKGSRNSRGLSSATYSRYGFLYEASAPPEWKLAVT